MRRVSKTFLHIGGILAAISVFACLGCAIFYIGAKDLSGETIRVMITGFEKLIPGASEAEKIENARKIFVLFGYCMLVESAVSVPAAIVTFMSRPKTNTGLFIATIILNALIGSVFGILGGIFGLVANGQEARQQQNPNVVDAQ